MPEVFSKLLVRFVANVFMAPIRNTAINDASRAYSIAVAPDSSAEKSVKIFCIMVAPITKFATITWDLDRI